MHKLLKLAINEAIEKGILEKRTYSLSNLLEQHELNLIFIINKDMNIKEIEHHMKVYREDDKLEYEVIYPFKTISMLNDYGEFEIFLEYAIINTKSFHRFYRIKKIKNARID